MSMSQYFHDFSTNIPGEVDLMVDSRNNDLMFRSDAPEVTIRLLLKQERIERLLQTNN